ncbi:hypothetical protein E5288_WYG002483 [Bos mutus]|uniref:Uncharacterized protein n=1 Tax=Bos mutus TaxID=72004 RepID=A0A6B0R458_9CETA|nr:hypothetical protein [Bos mutus]
MRSPFLPHGGGRRVHAAGPLRLAGTQLALGRAARAGSCGAWRSPSPSSKRRRRTDVGVRAWPWGSVDGLTEKGTHGVQPGAPSTQIIRPSSADPSSSSPTQDSRPRDQFSSEAAQPVPAHQQRLWLLAKAGLKGS